MKKISIMFLFALLFISLPIYANATGNASVSAEHAILYEPHTDTVIYEKNGDARAPMASTTKIMTALVAIENGDLDRTITIPAEACGIEGSSIYMTPGEKLTMRQLLYALLLQSANDAATAIAYDIAGNVDEFAALMNRRAEEMGLQNTHFENPHGLDAAAHYTSAHDLARIAAVAMENDTFREIVSTKKYTIPHSNGADVRVLVNHNKLLRLYDNAVGIKTGFTKKSGRCLVGAAEKDGLTLITVTLDAPNDWNDHISLFDYGFSKMENRMLCGAGEFVYELPLLGEDNRYAHVKNVEALYAVLPTDAATPEVILDLPRYVTKSSKPGRAIGTIRFRLNDKIIAEGTLILSEFT